ncbi:MAG: sulfurtransferase TusA family protein [Gammaproteobacteria bacterium]|nr:sulfurtransferase TusA family protein [Gammaproteobacteria bacterium]
METDSIPCDMYVDISGLDCGAPFSKLAEAIEVLEDGKVLMAVTQKEAMVSDVPSYCRQMNLELVGQGEDDQQFYFLIKK